MSGLTQYEKAYKVFKGTNNVQNLCDLARIFYHMYIREELSGKQFGFMGTIEHLKIAICEYVRSFGATAFAVGNSTYPDKFLVMYYDIDIDTSIRFRVDCIEGKIIEEEL